MGLLDKGMSVLMSTAGTVDAPLTKNAEGAKMAEASESGEKVDAPNLLAGFPDSKLNLAVGGTGAVERQPTPSVECSNIVIDLESLDTSESAIVLTLGAVKVDFDKGVIGETLYLVLDITDQLLRYRTASESTQDWWAKQNEAARNAAFGRPDLRIPTTKALEKFTKFIQPYGKVPTDLVVWGNGPDFDNAIMLHLYKTFEVAPPFAHFNNGCLRTLMRMLPRDRRPKFDGTKHNALDDAMHEARCLLEVNKCLKNVDWSA